MRSRDLEGAQEERVVDLVVSVPVQRGDELLDLGAGSSWTELRDRVHQNSDDLTTQDHHSHDRMQRDPTQIIFEKLPRNVSLRNTATSKDCET